MNTSDQPVRGFTLVELIVGLTIFGIAMLAAIPNLHRANDTWRLKESVATVETSIRRARSVAVKQSNSVRVVIDAATRECIVEIDSDDDGTFETLMATGELNQNVMFESIDFQGDASLVFDERGAPENPGSVILRTRRGFALEIMVSAGSGSVSVFEVPDPI